MRTRVDSCVICGEEVRVPIVNQPWCQPCIEKEEDRHQKEDGLGGCCFVRPPKYVISRDQWEMFGY